MKENDPVTSPIGFELSEEDLESISGGVEVGSLAVNRAGGFAIRNAQLNLGGFAIRNAQLNLGGFAIRNAQLNLMR
jgi:hypothetical protein